MLGGVLLFVCLAAMISYKTLTLSPERNCEEELLMLTSLCDLGIISLSLSFPI